MIWRGFHNQKGRRYSVDLPEEKANYLFEKLKRYSGSHEEFYFGLVNPAKLLEPEK